MFNNSEHQSEFMVTVCELECFIDAFTLMLLFQSCILEILSHVFLQALFASQICTDCWEKATEMETP